MFPASCSVNSGIQQHPHQQCLFVILPVLTTRRDPTSSAASHDPTEMSVSVTYACVSVSSVIRHFPLHFWKYESEKIREPSYLVTVSNLELIHGGSLVFPSLWLLVSPRDGTDTHPSHTAAVWSMSFHFLFFVMSVFDLSRVWWQYVRLYLV